MAFRWLAYEHGKHQIQEIINKTKHFIFQGNVYLFFHLLRDLSEISSGGGRVENGGGP